jgi:hypothetical protein
MDVANNLKKKDHNILNIHPRENIQMIHTLSLDLGWLKSEHSNTT